MATAPAPASATPYHPAPENGSDARYRLPLAILTSLFFMWGFLTCLNDILIPHLKAAFSLSYTQAALVQFCFFTAYCLVSVPAGSLVRRLGYQRGIVVGLVAASAGCVLFYPAAATRSYPLFLSALFVLAAGITVLQVSANPYVAILGPPHTASSRLTLTQAFNSLGTTLAPAFGAAFILSVTARGATELSALSPADQVAYKAAEAASVQVPYLGLAAVLALMAVVMGRLRLPQVNGASSEPRPTEGKTDGKTDGKTEDLSRVLPDRGGARRYPHLVLGALAIFLYVGGEVSIGSFLVNFLHQPDIGDLSEQAASQYLGYYWGGAMVGRFVGALVLSRFRPGRVLALNAGIAAILCVVTMALSGHAAMWSILAVGLWNSILFPTIFTLALSGLGRHTEEGSGLLCMAIVGGAIVPVAQGALADTLGIHHAFFLPALCYLYIAWYGLRGSIPRAAGAYGPGAAGA